MTKRKNAFFTIHEFIHEKAGMKKKTEKTKKNKKIQNKSLVLVV